MKNPKIGDVVRIEFQDHVCGADEILKCVAYGRVAKITADAITIDTWHPLLDSDTAKRDHGHDLENFTLMRKVVVGMTKLEPVES